MIDNVWPWMYYLAVTSPSWQAEGRRLDSCWEHADVLFSEHACVTDGKNIIFHINQTNKQVPFTFS